MKTRSNLRSWLAIVALGLAIVSAHGAASSTRTNILFIAVDDMRAELGCYGNSNVISPNLDKLASSGVFFRRAYCQQAVCNPSRASLMTGLRPDTTHVWDLVTDLRKVMPDVITLPQYFRQHGYRAVAYGKIYHNIFPDKPSWDEPTHNATGVIAYSEANRQQLAAFKNNMKARGATTNAIERMRGPATEMQEQPDNLNFDGKQTDDALAKMKELAAGDAPFFLAVGYIRPHLPFITPKKYWDMYDRAKIPLAANGFMPKGAPAVAFGDRSMGGFYELRDYMDYADAPSPFDRPLTEAQQRELKHGYYASVTFTDAQIGRLLAGLEELGLAQNTIVVMWSDHGWKLGEHGGWCKQTNYEIDTRAPLMIRAPGAKANGHPTDALVEFVDIYPTVCELAGLPVPNQLAGKSLVPLLNGTADKIKDAAFSQFPRKHEGKDYMGYAMRTTRYRYVEWLDSTTGKISAQELYDHAVDEAENENLAVQPSRAALLAELSGQLWKALPKPQPKSVAANNESANKNAGANTGTNRVIAGWTVHVNPALLEAGKRDTTEHALAGLQKQLEDIVRVVPAAAVTELQKVPLWVSPEYPGVQPRAEYHPGAGWLRDHGRNPAMAKGVEFTNVRIWDAETRRMPVFALHELAHSYHDRVLGNDHPDIKTAYEHAKAGGKYDKVKRQDANGRITMDRAYAMTNEREYFAECTEAFFGRNDFYPFNREELKEQDPEVFEVLRKVWGER